MGLLLWGSLKVLVALEEVRLSSLQYVPGLENDYLDDVDAMKKLDNFLNAPTDQFIVLTSKSITSRASIADPSVGHLVTLTGR